MKTKFDPTDNLFNKAVRLDNPGIEPDKATMGRLNYYFMLKQPARRLHSNSFSELFLWLFSLKGVGMKAGFVSVCLAYFLFVGNIKNNAGFRGLTDTCQVHQELVDTNYMVKDTCK